MIKFAFFGTEKFSVIILEELKKAGLIPSLVITPPDKKRERGLELKPCQVKMWAEENQIKVLSPEKLDQAFVDSIKNEPFDLFVVASYGKIIPSTVLEIPQKGCLNVHPSMLPKYRGATPIESAMLDDQKNTGVTIMLMDEKMDHGPILKQKEVYFNEWPTKVEVENKFGEIGGELLVETMNEWVLDKIAPIEQDDTLATFTKKIEKEDGQIDWQDGQRMNFLKIQAHNPWPGAFFFHTHNDKSIRVKITKASWFENKLNIEKVIPEGKNEMSFKDFVSGYKFPTEFICE